MKLRGISLLVGLLALLAGCSSPLKPDTKSLAEIASSTKVSVMVVDGGFAYVFLDIGGCHQIDAHATVAGVALNFTNANRSVGAVAGSPGDFSTDCTSPSFEIDRSKLPTAKGPVVVEIADGSATWSLTIDDALADRTPTVMGSTDGQLHIGKRTTVSLGNPGETLVTCDIHLRSPSGDYIYDGEVFDGGGGSVEVDGPSASFVVPDDVTPQAAELSAVGNIVPITRDCHGPASCSATIYYSSPALPVTLAR